MYSLSTVHNHWIRSWVWPDTSIPGNSWVWQIPVEIAFWREILLVALSGVDCEALIGKVHESNQYDTSVPLAIIHLTDMSNRGLIFCKFDQKKEPCFRHTRCKCPSDAKLYNWRVVAAYRHSVTLYTFHHHLRSRALFLIIKLAAPNPPNSFRRQAISQLINGIPLLLSVFSHKKSRRILSILLITQIGKRKEDIK